MSDGEREPTRLGQRTRAKERARRARAPTFWISRAHTDCRVTLAPGPSCHSAHYTVSYVAGQRLPRGAQKALTGCKVSKNPREGLEVLEMAFRRVALSGPPCSGRCTVNSTDPESTSLLGGEVAACCVELARSRAWPATFGSIPLTRSIPRLLILATPIPAEWHSHPQSGVRTTNCDRAPPNSVCAGPGSAVASEVQRRSGPGCRSRMIRASSISPSSWRRSSRYPEGKR